MRPFIRSITSSMRLRLGYLFVLAFAVLFAPLAFAQPAAAPAGEPSFFAKLISPEGIIGALGTAATLFGIVKALGARRKRLIALATFHAFHIVEDLANETEGEDGLDKAKVFLEKADEYMRANGWRPLKPGEQHLAALNAQSIHGAQLTQAKVIAKAQELASDVAAAAPQFEDLASRLAHSVKNKQPMTADALAERVLEKTDPT